MWRQQCLLLTYSKPTSYCKYISSRCAQQNRSCKYFIRSNLVTLQQSEVRMKRHVHPQHCYVVAPSTNQKLRLLAEEDCSITILAEVPSQHCCNLIWMNIATETIMSIEKWPNYDPIHCQSEAYRSPTILLSTGNNTNRHVLTDILTKYI